MGRPIHRLHGQHLVGALPGIERIEGKGKPFGGEQGEFPGVAVLNGDLPQRDGETGKIPEKRQFNLTRLDRGGQISVGFLDEAVYDPVTEEP